MEKTKQARPAGTIKAKRPKQDMAVIIHDIPPTYDWGWYSREDARMHVQTVDRKHLDLHYKIWLENRGKRVFEPEPGIPSKVLKAVEKAVGESRERLEAEWASFMIKKGWLRAQLTGSVITFYAYAKSPNHFERTLAVSEIVGNKEYADKLSQRDIGLSAEYACLELYPHLREGLRMHEPLGKILWED